MANLLSDFDLAKDVQAFKKTTEDSLQNVKNNILTPINTTTRRLDEGVANITPDDTTLKGRITAYRGEYVEQLNGVVGAISGGLLNVKDITRSFKIGKNGVVFDTDNIISAVARSVGFNVSGKTGAMKAIARTITKEFNRLTGLNMEQLIETDGKSFRVNGNWRGQLGMQTLDMLREYSGIDEFLDVSVQTAFYNSILYNSSIFGMSDAYKSLWDRYPYMAARQDAFIEAMKYMITNGDVESISVVMGMIDAQGKNVLLNKYPDFITTLFSKFTFDPATLPEDYPGIREKLLAVVVAVAGPNWLYRETQFGRAYNLAITTKISADMVKLLTPRLDIASPFDELVPFLCTAGMFQEQSALTVLTASIPNSPITYL